MQRLDFFVKIQVKRIKRLFKVENIYFNKLPVNAGNVLISLSHYGL